MRHPRWCGAAWHSGIAAVRGQRRRTHAAAWRACRRNRGRADDRRARAGRCGMISPREEPALHRNAAGTAAVPDEATPATALAGAKRLIVKIGSALLVEED